MDLKLPLVVAHHAARHVEAWLPLMPDVWGAGPSLAELRDDLALRVMEAFEHRPQEDLGAFQLPPHVSLARARVDTMVRDQKRGIRYPIQGEVSVLVEKWPGDTFHVITPIKLLEARFALSIRDDLTTAVNARLAAFCLKHKIKNLEPYCSPRRERLDLLEVEVYPRSILPNAPRKPPRKTSRKKAAEQPTAETPQEREERRMRRRLSATTLREVGRNLTHAAMDDTLDRCFGREALVEQLVDELESREGVAICLVGPSGCGKTAIMHEVTRRLHQRYARASARRDVWSVDGNRFIAGMSYVGQWEERAQSLVAELMDLGDILCVDDLCSLVYAGRTRQESTNVAQYLEPHLSRGELTILAESTPERFQRMREESPTFAAQFSVRHVEELSERQTLPVLLGALRETERHNPHATCRLSPSALEELLHLTQRFMVHQANPGKSIRLLRGVLAHHQGRGGEPSVLQAAQVFETFQAQTGLPDFVVGKAAARTRAQVSAQFSSMVAGQPAAVEALTDVVMLMQSSLADPQKPLATLMFVGPTGVGKTESAKALARCIFGGAQRLVRFDMSEFSDAGTITRLLGHAGSPDGELTLALKTQPFSVILFDEVEKAHPQVFDALLQLLGEGRLTDAAGHTADARQSVIVMTSNLGVREAATRTGFSTASASDAQHHYVAAVKRFFRPEFFNRVDRVVPFEPLSRDALGVVVDLALKDLLGRKGIQSGNVMVDVEPALLEMLVEQAFDPRYGARPLKRAMERNLTVPLARHLVRRQQADLSLVELHRHADRMGMTVRVLQPAAAVENVVDPSRWSNEELPRRFRETHQLCEAMARWDVVEKLRNQRTELLSKGVAADPSGILELLDELDEARAEVEELAETTFSAVEVLERVHRAGKKSRMDDSGRRTTGGVSQEVQETKLDGVFRSHRDVVSRLWRRVSVVGCLLALAETEPVTSCSLLVECGSSESIPSSLWHLVSALPSPGKRGVFACVRGHWVPVHSGRQVSDATRLAVTYTGHGVERLLAPWTGYAEVLSDGPSPRRIVARLEVLEGANLDAAVKQHDATLAREKVRLRSRASLAEVAGSLVLRAREGATHLIHVATGLGAQEWELLVLNCVPMGEEG